MFLSAVTKPTNPFATMSLRSSPLRLPDHPISTTVLISCPGNWRRRRLGTHSSSSSRISLGHAACELEGSDGLFATDAGKVLQELVERVTALEIVVERLHRHSRPDKDRRST